MKIRSNAFENNGFIPPKYTCDGSNINPPLEFTNIPEETESLALIVDDPDAPNKTWVHWVLWNIHSTTEKINEGETPPEARTGINDFGEKKYGGPCPPSGIHRYFFKLYALSNKIELDKESTKQDLVEEIDKYKIDSSVIMGKYSKQS